MGPLTKLSSMILPNAGRVYEDAVSFGKQLPGHNQDGEGDAARHAYASAMLAKQYGPLLARILGHGHELFSLGQDRRAQSMDEFNNQVGLGLADIPEEQLKEHILGLLNEKKLKTLPKTVETQGYARGGLVQMKECKCG